MFNLVKEYTFYFKHGVPKMMKWGGSENHKHRGSNKISQK